ncbi:MAG TPA: hypothetical protein VGC41_11065 [Kofleriaceae bacterium]
MKTIVLALVLLAILAFNPMFGFLRDTFDYDEADMKHAIEGRWKLAYGGHTVELAITEGRDPERHSSRGWLNAAEACGTRSFVNTADACVDLSRMSVSVATGAARTHGTFTVMGESFRAGNFEVELDGLYVSAKVDRQGAVTWVMVVDQGRQADHPTLTRL